MWQKIKNFLYDYGMAIFITLLILGNGLYQAYKYEKYRSNLYDRLETSCNRDYGFGLRGETYVCINEKKVIKQCGKEN